MTYLVQDLVVVVLGDADELTVVDGGAHDAFVIELLHRWRDAKADDVKAPHKNTKPKHIL